MAARLIEEGIETIYILVYAIIQYSSIYISIHLYIYLFIYMSIHLYIYLSIYISIHLYIYLSHLLGSQMAARLIEEGIETTYILVSAIIHPSIYLSIYVYIYLSIYIFIYLYIYLSHLLRITNGC